jgi:hypothetical protein
MPYMHTEFHAPAAVTKQEAGRHDALDAARSHVLYGNLHAPADSIDHQTIIVISDQCC